MQRIQWQCSGCLCLWKARTRSSSSSQWRRLTIVLSSLRRQWCFDAVGCRSIVHRATVCSGMRYGCNGCIMVLSMLALWQRRWRQQLRHLALVVAAPSCSECSGIVVAASAGGRLALAVARACSGDSSRSCSAACSRNGISMLWAVWALCHARAVAAVLVAAAEALYTRGGCTLVQQMQWQCGSCLCWSTARTRSSSCSQWRRLTIALSSLQQQWCVDAVGCMGSVHRATVCSGVRSGCSGCIMVLSMLALWQRRWRQQLRHSTLVVAAPSCSKCSGNVVAASAGRRFALAAARARSGDASRSCSAACDGNGVSMLWAAWAVCTERQCALVCDLDAVDASWCSACSCCGSGAGGSS